MNSILSYQLSDGIAILRMDDGKGNAWGFAMMDAIGAAFDRAHADQAVVVITGRPGLFSGGMDLAVFKRGGPEATRMMQVGGDMLERLIKFPRPVLAAVNGHAMGMGAVCLLACDVRVAVAEGARIQTNEVEMGAPMPHTALALGRARLSTRHLSLSMLSAETYTAAEAVAAGYLDAIAPVADFEATVVARARALAKLDAKAFAETKRRLYLPLLTAMIDTKAQDSAYFAAKFGNA